MPLPDTFPIPGDDGLHRPISADYTEPDDWVVCATDGEDLSSMAVCPNAPMADCGCMQYLAVDNDHWPHE